MQKYFLFIAFILVTRLLSAQSHWESLVSAPDTWSYLIGEQAPPGNWMHPDFDATAWEKAAGGFGYGDGDDQTILQIDHSLYIRNRFSIGDLSLIDSLVLDIDYDDAWVGWLNGMPIGRSHNVEVALPIYDYSPTIDQEARLYQGLHPERVSIPVSYLREGENVLAIQGINMGPGSSDFSLAPWLQARINSEDLVYQEPPSWFRRPDLPLETHLPIMVITTGGGMPAPWESKTTAELGVILSYTGKNTYPGSFNNYSGSIGIKARGSSSYWIFDKKNYSFETRNADGSNNNVSLLNLPIENDWVLHGPFSDKSLVRNALAYELARKMGQYAPRTAFCELILNGEYRGLYLLVEKVKQDRYRVDISELNPDEVSGEEMTGGYILRIDRTEEAYWASPIPTLSNNALLISYYDPKPEHMPLVQKNYIREQITNFELALAGDLYQHPELGYQPMVDLQSFVDFMLVNELSKNVDAYRLSTYIHKDRDREGVPGRIKAGPVWDFNLGFGNVNYGGAELSHGWSYLQPGGDYGTPFWWKRMMEDPAYHNLAVDTWRTYRQSFLSNEQLFATIDSLVALVGDEAAARNFETHPVLGTYIWPNHYIGQTWEDELTFLKDWTATRMSWMDSQLDSHMEPYGTSVADHSSSLASVYPNPVDRILNILMEVESVPGTKLELWNLSGQLTYSATLPAGHRRFTLGPDVIGQAMPQKGMYILTISAPGSDRQNVKVLKE